MSALRALPPPDASVLVIDDDHDLLEAVCEVLRDAGYRVASAGNGFDALRVLSGRPLPDLILLDLMMPVMDGYSFRKVQLSDPVLSAVPTIALSAGIMDGRLAELGLAAWMSKPVSVRSLVGAVERHRLRRPGEAPAAAGPSAHSVQFYQGAEHLAVDVAQFLAPALLAGDGVVTIATGEHWRRVESRLAAAGCDPIGARASGQLQVLDARRTLESFTAAGAIIERRFTDAVAPVLAAATGRGGRPRAYGEMVDLLWQDGEVAAALELELCWNRLLSTARCDLHCAYAEPVTAQQRESARRVRQVHGEIAVAAAH